ncbi:hypothetical protein PoB_000580300 [Plakobranchus ocellatus]|uniref:BESS domain-containing protein n=1 Tax=Plakobranchus ocellatus TaxID=259542 RepID=A0AAV3YAX5_9GAST|nr:hypothetical protein PoB_000580300 [Plakobranchus ocellatus]
MGHAPVRGNYGSVVPAEELLDTEDEVGQGVTRPTILEESQCASSSSASSLSVSPPPSISPSPTPSHSRSASARGKKRHHEEASAWEEAACDFFRSRQQAPPPENPDLSFLKGLLPLIGGLNMRRKRLFFAEITQLLVQHMEFGKARRGKCGCPWLLISLRHFCINLIKMYIFHE